MKDNACPCCGATLDVRGDVIWNAAAGTVQTPYAVARLTVHQAAIFDALWKSRGARRLTRERLIDVIYVDDPDGGTNVNSIAMAVMRLRVALSPLGIEIVGGTSSGEGYRLRSTKPFAVRPALFRKTGIVARSGTAEYMREYRALGRDSSRSAGPQ